MNDSGLTLTEEMLLLLCDEDGTPLAISQDILGCALAGAALMDLAFENRIDTDLQTLFVSDPTPTDNAMLNCVLEKITGASNNADTGTWIRRLAIENSDTIHQQALASLGQRNIAVAANDNFLWRALFGKRYTVDSRRLRSSREKIASVLLSDEIPHPREIALISLMDACGIAADVLSPQTARQSRQRLRQIRRLDLVGRELGDAVAKIERSILQTVRVRSRRFRKLLVILSVGAGAMAAGTLVSRPFPIPDRFGANLLEQLWFNDVWQQWSGYMLLALSFAGLGAVMLTKLKKIASLSGFHGWRVVHAALGIGCLIALFAHTGFRFGANLNAILMGCYLTALGFGAVAGISINGVSRLRRFGFPASGRVIPLRFHILALCPLPALVAVHILTVYLY